MTKLPAEAWLELRDDIGRLHGRLDLTSGQLEMKLQRRRVVFDLVATLRERRPVVVRIAESDKADGVFLSSKSNCAKLTA